MPKRKKYTQKRPHTFITDTLINSIGSSNSTVRITDVIPGLFLAIFPTGTKTWYVRKHCNGKRIQVRIGKYSDGYTIEQARKAAMQVNNYVNIGTAIDVPTMLTAEDLRKLNPKGLPPACTFRDMYSEWYSEIGTKTLDSKYLGRVENQIKTHILPYFGETEATDVTSEMIKGAAKKLEEKGNVETAHRVVGLCSRIFKYGVSQKKTKTDPADSLKGTLVASQRKSMPAIHAAKEDRIGELIYKARHSNEPYANMLLMLAYTFVRPGELRVAEWGEFDLYNGLWSIPAERMRMSQPHIVPLSRQAIAIFNELNKRKVSKYVFPLGSNPASGRPADANAILELLPKLGFDKEEMSAIGFRTLAKSIFESSDQCSSALIEKQFPHNAGNRTSSSVSNNLEYIKERKAMVQWYADKLDSFEKGYAQKLGTSRGIGIAGK